MLAALGRATDDEHVVNVDRYFEVELVDIIERAEAVERGLRPPVRR